MKRRIKI